MARSRRGRFRLPQEGASLGRALGRWVGGILLVAAVAGGGWWFWMKPGSRAPAVQAPTARTPEPVRPVVATTGAPPAVPVVPVRTPTPLVAVSTNLIQRPVPDPGPGVVLTTAPPSRVNLGTQLVARVTSGGLNALSGTNAGQSPPGGPAGPSPGGTNQAEARATNGWIARPATNLLEAQIALAGFGISVGSIDGVGGAQTAAALRAFQMQQGLEQTGRLDPATLSALKLGRPPLGTFLVEEGHLAGLRPVPSTWLDKSRTPWMGFETLIELVGEAAHSHPALLRRLNPGVDWDGLRPGVRLTVPQPGLPPGRRAARIRISLAGRFLRIFDDRGIVLAHFPCSIGRVAALRPVGDLRVATVVKDPNYTFDPRVFPESAEGRRLGRKLIIPPGPNNPVGVAWIGLDRPGYGIHGTPGPEQVGRTESHGCFRLANWNADFLRRMAWVGLPVSVEP